MSFRSVRVYCLQAGQLWRVLGKREDVVFGKSKNIGERETDRVRDVRQLWQELTRPNGGKKEQGTAVRAAASQKSSLGQPC